MANKKGIKWIVGLSGAALYSVLVGYLSQGTEDSAHATATSSVNPSPEQSDQDSLMQQWGSDSGGRHGRGGFGSEFGSGNDGGFTDNSDGGGLRTRGS
ncbi:hypothetical protein [Cohnella sp. AR92]|uniref:hypothetical protein n=1 Tax=Cohnella sp. AR92 TaxID=648716 RepID=UPI000F8D35FA|nr:hypothetical protein [Cohnella sp. AR92]RUS48682.1 hypothetical protein ELR57_04560 [Cohnella sp. AR92]